MITVSGLGSGLDINSLVDQLLAAEGDAKTAILAQKRVDVEAEISAFGSLKATLSSFQSSISSLTSIDSFNLRSAESGDKDVFTVTADNTAVAGVFDVEVRALAESHKLLSNGYVDVDSNVGTGQLTLATGGSSFTVNITSENQTLSGVMNAINDAEDNTGISATIINVDNGGGGTESKLVLTASETGSTGSITVTAVDTDGNNTDTLGLSALVYDPLPAGTGTENLTQINVAQDADVRIDGQQVTSSSNTLTDAIQGITLNLVAAKLGEEIELSVSLDTTASKNQILTFVNSYNSVMQLVNDLSSFDAETGVGSILLGDATLNGIAGQIRRQISSNVSATGLNQISNLVDLGITTDATGLLQVDNAKLDQTIQDNFAEVGTLFSDTNGIANRIDTILDGYLKFDGVLDTKTAGLNSTITRIDDQFEVLDRRLESLEERLIQQFSALDGLLAQLQSTSEFLDQQLSAISNINNDS